MNIPKQREFSIQELDVWNSSAGHPGYIGHHMFIPLTIQGNIDCPRLIQGFEHIARQHSILRTGYREEGGHLQAWIADEIKMPILTGTSSSAFPSQEEIKNWVEKPWDMSQPPLWGVWLLPGQDQSRILFKFSHIIVDGYSIGLILSELARFYNEYPKVRKMEVFDYAEFANWEQEQSTLWRNTLASLQNNYIPKKGKLDLPYDHPQAEKEAEIGEAALLMHFLTSEQSERVKQLAQKLQILPFQIYLMAYERLLSQISGTTDFYIQMPHFNRGQVRWLATVGLFVDGCFIPSTVKCENPLQTLSASFSQIKPMLEIPVSWWQAAYEKENGYAPTCAEFIFQGDYFNFNLSGKPCLIDGELLIRHYFIWRRHLKLILQIVNHQNKMAIAWIYRKVLWEKETMEKWLAEYVRILDEILSAE